MGHSGEHVTEVQKVNKRSFKLKFKTKRDFPNGVYRRCGNSHRGNEYKNATCAFCKKKRTCRNDLLTQEKAVSDHH